MRTFYTSKCNRTVVTFEQDGIYSSRLWVNCKESVISHPSDLGDATLTSAKHRTERGARNWANKVLAK
jgi:hypothetical protein